MDSFKGAHGKIYFDPRLRYDGDRLNQFFGNILLLFDKNQSIPVPPDHVELLVTSSIPRSIRRSIGSGKSKA